MIGNNKIRIYIAAILAASHISVATIPAWSQEQTSSPRELRQDIKKLGKEITLAQKSSDYRQIITLSEKLLPLIARSKGEQSKDYAKALNSHAVYLMRGGQSQKAEPVIKRALELLTEAYGAQHTLTLSAFNNVATNLYLQGRYKDAEPVLRHVMGLRSEVLGAQHPDTLSSIANLALNLMQQGRHGEAERLNQQAYALRRDKLGVDHRDTLTSLNALAGNLDLQGRYKEAEPLFRQALAATTKKLGPNDPGTLIAMDNLASNLAAQGRHKEAEPLNRQSLKSSIARLGKKHPDTLISMGMLASNLDRQGKFEEALALKKQALELSTSALGENHPDTITALGNLAYSMERSGKLLDAGKLYQKSLKLSIATLGRDHPDTLSSQGNLAINLLAQGSHPAALETARAAASGWQRRSAALGYDAMSQAEFIREEKSRQGYFRLVADAGWAAHNNALEKTNNMKLREEAFVALQNSMSGSTSRALAQAVARKEASTAAAGLGILVRRREALSRKWQKHDLTSNKFLTISGSRSQKLREGLRVEKSKIENEIATIDKKLQTEFPQYFGLVRPQPLPIKQAQALLAADEALLMVVPSARGTHVIALSSDNAKWARAQAGTKEINKMVRRLLWDVGANVAVDNAESAKWEEEGVGAYPYDRTTAHKLYQQIVAPMSDILTGKVHVTVAAAGALSSLPLGLLVTQPPVGADGDPQSLRETKWLADVHAITHIPSIQSLQLMRRDRRHGNGRPTDGSFIGFGDPLLSGRAATRGSGRGRTRGGSISAVFRGQDGGDGAGLADVGELRKMARLPGTATELEQMREALGAPATSVMTAQAASETAVRTTDLSKARILAFATHGILAGEVSGAKEPGLVFTPPAKSSLADDGLLAASEVASLDLNADWVILSACNTASSDGTNGSPGLSGLARAFFYAGAKNLLVSHWPVRDDIAARLTVRTIEIANANKNLSRAQAFQHAMREIRNDSAGDSDSDTWAHPNAWAPFSLVGDVR